MMDYQNLLCLWTQWRMALLQLTIYRCMFWTDYLIVLPTNLRDDECDGVNAEDELRTVLSMLHDAYFHFCYKKKVSIVHICKV